MTSLRRLKDQLVILHARLQAMKDYQQACHKQIMTGLDRHKATLDEIITAVEELRQAENAKEQP